MYVMSQTCMAYTYISMEKDFGNFECYKILNLWLSQNVHIGTYECIHQYVIVGTERLVKLFCNVLQRILKPYLEQCIKSQCKGTNYQKDLFVLMLYVYGCRICLRGHMCI